jgi:hypothetical protein
LPLPMERNAILSRFNEVLGAKTAETAMPEVEEPFMVLKEVENGDDNLVDIVDDVSGVHTVQEPVVSESPITDVE